MEGNKSFTASLSVYGRKKDIGTLKDIFLHVKVEIF